MMKSSLVVLSLCILGATAQGLSRQCLDALASDQVTPDCLYIPNDKTVQEFLDARCGQPADGHQGHTCSREQRSTALSLIDVECKHELEQGVPQVVNLRFFWAHLIGREAVACLKDEEDHYCIVDANDEKKQRDLLAKQPVCDLCTKNAWYIARHSMPDDVEPIGESDPNDKLDELLTIVDAKCGYSKEESNSKSDASLMTISSSLLLSINLAITMMMFSVDF
jgi:hypothetical protein